MFRVLDIASVGAGQKNVKISAVARFAAAFRMWAPNQAWVANQVVGQRSRCRKQLFASLAVSTAIALASLA
jgi:hypothetical protein